MCYPSCMSDLKTCTSCHAGNAELICGLCRKDICKSCTEHLGNDSFSFMKKVPKELLASKYCFFCYSSHVLPAKKNYKEVMNRAKEIFIIEKAPRKPLPILKRS